MFKIMLFGLNLKILVMKRQALVKENKDHTYLSTDIAYHKNKIERNFDKVLIYGEQTIMVIFLELKVLFRYSRGKSKLCF